MIRLYRFTSDVERLFAFTVEDCRRLHKTDTYSRRDMLSIASSHRLTYLLGSKIVEATVDIISEGLNNKWSNNYIIDKAMERALDITFDNVGWNV